MNKKIKKEAKVALKRTKKELYEEMSKLLNKTNEELYEEIGKALEIKEGTIESSEVI